jgi:hypothetical protein
MAKYYFHFQEGGQLITDEEGTDLPNLLSARAEAIKAARELLTEAIKFGVADVPEAVVISNQAGLMLDSIPLHSILPSSLNLTFPRGVRKPWQEGIMVEKKTEGRVIGSAKGEY